MFGTMGFSELIIILVIVLIIFGAGRLPQIGEGLGKALKGFKKEVHEVPPPPDETAPSEAQAIQAPPQQVGKGEQGGPQPAQAGQAPELQGVADQAAPKSNAPYTPGPEMTPGTTAAMLYAAGPQPYQPQQTPPAAQPPAPPSGAKPVEPAAQASPPTMEERMTQPPPTARASYPALPPNARPKPGAPRPSAVVNKAAVARVQAQQVAMKQAAAQTRGTASPQDMQSVGEGLGDALRTFRQAAADVRGAIEPEMRTLESEMDSAQKEIQQTVESAKQMPALHEDPPQSNQT